MTGPSSEREHRPDCPAAFFTDHPERCRCAVMDELWPLTDKADQEGER